MEIKFIVSAAMLFAAFAASGQQVVRPPPASSLTNSGVISNWVMPVPDLSTLVASLPVQQGQVLNFGASGQPTFLQPGANWTSYNFFCYAPGQPLSQGPSQTPACSDGGGVTITGSTPQNIPGGSSGSE